MLKTFLFVRICCLLAVVYSLLPVVHAQTNTQMPRPLGTSLVLQANEQIQKKEYGKAISLYTRWLEADPQDQNSWYNLACAYALSDKKSQAFDALENAVTAGYRDINHTQNDSDLVSLRSDPRYDAILKRIEKAVAAEVPENFIRRVAEMKSAGTYLVLLPPDYETSGKTYPLCVIVHAHASTDLTYGRMADDFGRDDVVYVVPRAPYPSVPAMLAGRSAWTAFYPVPPETEPSFTEALPLYYIEWIHTCIQDARSHYRVNKGKVALYGHSQGGGYATMYALVHSDEVSSVVNNSGPVAYPSLLTKENLQKMKERGVRVHLIHGEQDEAIPLRNSQKLEQAMKEEGVECSLQVVQGHHAVNEEMKTLVRRWLDKDIRRTVRQ